MGREERREECLKPGLGSEIFSFFKGVSKFIILELLIRKLKIPLFKSLKELFKIE